jgi:predicted nucleic acid-binding protein
MAIALDSSVLIALANIDDAHHGACTSKVIRKRYQYRASILAYLKALYGGFRDSYEVAIVASLDLLQRIDEVLDLNLRVAKRALEMIAESGFELADSVICATAEIYGDELWTCDKGMVSKFPMARYIGA